MTSNDVIERLTPKDTKKDAVRGLEEMGVTEGETKTGERACKKSGKKGKVRGNKIAGSSNPKKAQKHKTAAEGFLDGKSVRDLPVVESHTRS